MLMGGVENAMQDDLEECLAPGMDNYVTKPTRVDAQVQALLSVPARPQWVQNRRLVIVHLTVAN